MSSVQLLDKTRKIGKLLHNNNSSKVVFNDICNVLKEILQSNVLVISKKGKILGVGRTDGIETLDELFESKVGVFVDSLLNERFLSVLSTKENVNLETLGYEGEKAHQYKALLSPIDIAGERLGTLFIYKKQQERRVLDKPAEKICHGSRYLGKSKIYTCGCGAGNNKHYSCCACRRGNKH